MRVESFSLGSEDLVPMSFVRNKESSLVRSSCIEMRSNECMMNRFTTTRVEKQKQTEESEGEEHFLRQTDHPKQNQRQS